MYYVYILLCKGGNLYTGYTDNLKKRFQDHRDGKGGKYTRSHMPDKIVYKEKLSTKSKALKREIEIKNWSRKEKIEKLKLKITINSNLKLL